MSRVDFGREVNYSVLKKAIIYNAQKVGWKAIVREDDRGRFQLCEGDRLAMQVNVPFLDSVNSFYIYDGDASRVQVKEYMDNVLSSVNGVLE